MTKKISIEFDEYDLTLLNEIYSSWNALSSDPNDFASMTDHCHQSNDFLYALIMKLEKGFKNDL